MNFEHVSVMLMPTVDMLDVREGGVYVDGTLGRAGHSREIARRLTTGRLIAIDRDQAALEAAPERLESHLDKVTLIHGNFGDVAAILRGLNIPAVDGMLFDLGVSSPQLDDGSRGFSYQHDAPLDMRMDQSAPLTAFDVVNGWSQEELRRILWQYGEERYSGPIAAAIVRAREQAPIQTTGQLADDFIDRRGLDAERGNVVLTYVLDLLLVEEQAGREALHVREDEVGADRLRQNQTLTLTVLGQERDAVLDRLTRGLDVRLLALDGDILRRKAIVHINAQLAGGQVTHVAHAGRNFIAPAQVFADGLCFGGGLHYD